LHKLKNKSIQTDPKSKEAYPFPEKSKRKELICAFSNATARFSMRLVSYIGKKITYKFIEEFIHKLSKKKKKQVQTLEQRKP